MKRMSHQKTRRRRTVEPPRRNTPQPARQTEASVASLKKKNALLTRGLGEALEQQTATDEILRVISSSPTDVQPVFDMIAQSAARLCRAQFCHVFRFDGQLMHFAASHGLTPEGIEALRRLYPMAPGRASAAGRSILSGSVEEIPDVHADPDYEYVHTAKILNYRSIVAVPMLKDGRPIGAIIIGQPQAGRFPDWQIKLLKTFADHAVIAIENVRLFDEVQARTRDLTKSLEFQTATSEVLKVISSSKFDLQPVLDTLIETAARLCAADIGALRRRDGDSYSLAATFGHKPEWRPLLEGYSSMPTRGSVFGRTAIEGRTVHIPDVLQDPEWARADAQSMMGVRAALGVPLLREGNLIGVLILQRYQPGEFTRRQIELVETFADQAVIAIENVRLFDEVQARTRELSESLEQQTATSEVLSVISSSPGELEPVFQAMLANATRICEAKFGVLQLYEDGGFRIGATHNAPPSFAQALAQREPVFRPSPQHPLARVVATKQVVQISDLAEAAAYKERDPGAIRLVELAAARSLVAVPMLKDDVLIGVIVIYRQEVRPFTDKQIALVQNFAAQAVIAIENTRLLNELRRRTHDLVRSVEELKALGEVSQAVNSTLDLETVLSTIVAKAVQLSGTEAGTIYTFDDTTQKFELRSTYGMDDALIAAIRKRHIRIGGDPGIGQAAAKRAPVQIPDVRDEPSELLEDVVRRIPGPADRSAARPRSDRRCSCGPAQAARRICQEHRRATRDLCRSIGAGDPERTAVPRDRGEKP
jgi:GAF domain-containing protein